MIGFFDSGVGGLSVWREVVQRLPEQPTLYVADQTHVPYGLRPNHQILTYAMGITCFLVSRGCTLIIVACNTASAVALDALRQEFPGTHFIGMEPAVKPAANVSKNRVIGVLATPNTFRGTLFNRTVQQYAAAARVIRQPCPGLVEQIECGAHESGEMLHLLETFLSPSLQQGADTIVLGCTHYPFVQPRIEEIAGDSVQVIHSAPAVARQAERLLATVCTQNSGLHHALPALSQHEFLTTDDVGCFEKVASKLLRRNIRARTAVWTRAHRLAV